MTMMGGPRWLRSALFVDFDNIFISLFQQDRVLAECFATNPDEWLLWLEQQMPFTYIDSPVTARRILIRRCYLNPTGFGKYRPYFIRSAFEVVDCPPLTSQGKTSTDIHLVMDVLDTLGDPIHFDEFILLSGDSDFTPLLLRIRGNDRLSAVLSVGYISPAYKAACDYLIPTDTFIKEALDVDLLDEDMPEPFSGVVSKPKKLLLNEMATHLQTAAHRPGGIQASDLPSVYKEFPEFRQSNHWLGFYSLRSLTEAIIDCRDDLAITQEDPWRVVLRQTPTDEQEPATFDDTDTDIQDLRAEASQFIVRFVAKAADPVTMAKLAQLISQRFPRMQETNWLGAGSFKVMLETLDLGTLALSSVMPGYVYDPQQHEPPRNEDTFQEAYPELALLAQKINRLTDTPYLLPEHYAVLLRELAREINENGYQMTRTSKTVRDRCVERGAPIARKHVNFALTGISYAGHRFGEDTETVEQLTEALVRNTINLCRRAQMDLGDHEIAQIHRWIGAGIAAVAVQEPPAPAEPVADGGAVEAEQLPVT